MTYHNDGTNHKLIIGTKPGLLINDPTIRIFNVSYPEGIPDRNNPDRSIELTLESSLQCMQYKTVNYVDVTSSGMVVASTNQGIGLFHISWIPILNNMSISDAWNTIKIPIESFSPFWNGSWSMTMKDASFVDDNTLYCVKNPEGKNPGGIWRLTIDLNEEQMFHTSTAVGYYPGAQCGMDYSQFLQGWGNPDIETIHHPYALAVDTKGAYVTGWSGKVQEIMYTSTNMPPSVPVVTGSVSGKVGEEYTYSASSIDPEGSQLEYLFDWDDGTNSGWQTSAAISHIWNVQGDFNIKVKARDSDHLESGWGSLDVSMPKSKQFMTMFEECFPLLFKYFSSFNLR
jgi:hypothetical protein